METRGDTPISAFDVAAAWRERLGPVGAVRLHKLLYYSQAWHVTWFDRPLFEEQIEAWSLGPVVARLYQAEKYEDLVPKGNPEHLLGSAHTVMNFVQAEYGQMTGTDLSELSHSEDPWLHARELAGVGPGESSNVPIDLGSMAKYYRQADAADQAWFWTDDWQKGEAEVDREETPREVLSDEDFLAAL